MPFVAGQSGNPEGRRLANKKFHERKPPTSKELKDKELKQLLRRIKPLTTKSLSQLDTMLENQETSQSNRVRIIALILKTYQDTLDELYTDASSSNADDKDDEDKEDTAIISFDFGRKNTG